MTGVSFLKRSLWFGFSWFEVYHALFCEPHETRIEIQSRIEIWGKCAIAYLKNRCAVVLCENPLKRAPPSRPHRTEHIRMYSNRRNNLNKTQDLPPRNQIELRQCGRLFSEKETVVGMLLLLLMRQRLDTIVSARLRGRNKSKTVVNSANTKSTGAQFSRSVGWTFGTRIPFSTSGITDTQQRP